MKGNNLTQNPYSPFNFVEGLRGKYNTLDKADILSNIFFEKDYNDALTYERNYVRHLLVKSGVN